MNSSFFYSGYRSNHSEILELLNDQPGCNTTTATEYICNSAFPTCDIDSGEPIVVCENDCLVATTESDCAVFMETSSSYPISLNCSDPLQYLSTTNQSVAHQPLDQCLQLQGVSERTYLYFIFKAA